MTIGGSIVSLTRSAFYVRLSAYPNPERGQFGSMRIRSQWVRVESFAEASEACRAFIREHTLGSGNWSGGTVRSGSVRGRIVAVVSYNGRVWRPEPWTPESRPLWEPEHERSYPPTDDDQRAAKAETGEP